MIDTLSRHLAALREARRLSAMVLANNRTFRALQVAQTDGGADQIAACEAELSADHVYIAYRALQAALAQFEPPAAIAPAADGLRDQITLLAPAAPAITPPQPDVAASQPPYAAPLEQQAPATLSERLHRALELTSMADERANPAPALYTLQRDEARVAIVHREPSATGAMPPQVPGQSHPELVRLFR